MTRSLKYLIILLLIPIFAFAENPPILGGGGGSVDSYSDIVSLFGGGACTGFLKSDGTCATPAGGGDLVSTNNLSDVSNTATALSNLGAEPAASMATDVPANETDPSALKTAGTDNVKDTHIDWGTGASQVSADDVPDGATNIIPTATQETNWDSAYSNMITGYSEVVALFGGGSCSGYLKSDGTCDAGGGGGNVTKVGTPAQYEWGEWTGDGTLKGTAVSGSSAVCTDANGSPEACSNLADLAYQPADTELGVVAGLTSAANKIPYFTGSGTGDLLDLAVTVGDPGSDTTLVSEQGIREAISALSSTYQPLEATLTDIADGTIAENLVNTANPWADNEVADDITASNYLPLVGGTLSDTLITDASDATASGLRLPHGAAPSAPTNGDIWTTTSGLYARINGSTVGPFVEAAGSTVYSSIGDPTGVGLITFEDGETATYDGAWNDEVAITISLSAADLTGDTTGLLITAVDNDDANYIPLLIQDDQDGTPDDLFKVDYQGVVTATSYTNTPTSTPGMVFADQDAAAGTWDLYLRSSGGDYPILGTFYAEEDDGSDHAYMEIDGPDEAVNILKACTMSSTLDVTGAMSADGVNPDAADGAALGTTALEWSDAYFADGAVIYGQSDQSNTITSSAAGWTFNLFPMTPSAAPDADYEVANKKYVDDNIGGVVLADIVTTAPLLVNAGANLDDVLPGSDADITFSISAASTTASGVAELATTAETTTGTDTARTVTPDGLSGSVYGQKEIGWHIHDADTDTAVADGLQAAVIPASMNGMNLVDVTCSVSDLNSASGGATTVVLRRVRAGTPQDMTSTGVTIGYDEYTASDESVDTSYDDVQTGDEIFVDINAVTTGAVQKGLGCTAIFQTP